MTDKRSVVLRGPGAWIIKGSGDWTISYEPSGDSPEPQMEERPLEMPRAAPKPVRHGKGGRPTRMVKVTGAKGVFDPALEIENQSVSGRILEEIYDNGAKLRSELGRKIRASSSTISVQVRKLIMEGWLKENEDYTLSLAKKLECLPSKDDKKFVIDGVAS